MSTQFEAGLESECLKNWIKAGVQEKSYESVSKSIETLTGTNLYSGNQLSKKVKAYAKEETIEKIKTYNGLQICIPFSESKVNLYDENSDEIHIFDDAIGVKKQKRHREIQYKKQQKTVQTTVIEIQKKTDDFEYITQGFGVANWDIETALLCWISYNYGNVRMPVVAITDGAKEIRLRLWRIFGGQVIIILDWYHLQKKVNNLLSMIAFGNAQKKEHFRIISPLLWEGKIKDVLKYIDKIATRNELKKQELIDYLTKHEVEIINYKKRKEAKKTIGSGRAEKGVDLVVAQRQKNKPIAWSTDGSLALAVLKAHQLNQKIAA